MNQVSYTELLYKALGSPLGIAVSTTNPKLLQQKLYQARSKLEDPQLSQLSLVPSRSNPNEELWIVKKSAEKQNAET